MTASSRPLPELDDVEVRTEDGAKLRALVWMPDPDLGRGTVVMSHAMFARKSEFLRAGFAAHFIEAGFGVCAFDFRGHGDSVHPSASYDDFVRRDLPDVVRSVRLRTRGPVVVVGHSLGGHVAAASAGKGLLDADALVLVGSCAWLRTFEPSRLRFRAKVAVARASLATISRVGHLPARRLRLGSDDASAELARAVFRPALEGAWRSDDGADDYEASLARVHVPVLAVVSDGDRFMCHPDTGARFARATRGPHDVYRIARADDGRAAPGHMAMLTTSASRRAWHEISRFAKDAARRR